MVGTQNQRCSPIQARGKRQLRWPALLAVGLACSDDVDPPVAAKVAQVSISESVQLVLPNTTDVQLIASSLDTEGTPLERPVRWISLSESLAVDGQGRVSSIGAWGSGYIVAEVDGVRSQPSFVYFAEPSDQAVLYGSEQVTRGLTPRSANGLAQTFTVELSGLPSVYPGQLLLPRDHAPYMGHIVEVQALADSTRLTIEPVALAELFENLHLRDLRMIDAQGHVEILPRLEWPRSLALDDHHKAAHGCSEACFRASEGLVPSRLQCMAEGANSTALTTNVEIASSIHVATEVDVEISWGRLESAVFLLHAQGSAQAGLNISLPLDASGSASCNFHLRDLSFPLPGPLGVLAEAHVPIGLGAAVEGKAEGQLFALDAKADIGVASKFGFVYGADTGPSVVKEVTPHASSSLELTSPLSADGPVVSFSVFPHVSLGFGIQPDAWFLPDLEATEVFGGRVGVSQDGSFATLPTQILRPDYRSSYATNFRISGEPSDGVSDLLKLLDDTINDLVGLELQTTLAFDSTWPLASSPGGQLLTDPDPGLPGEAVRGEVRLREETRQYFGVPNIASVGIAGTDESRVWTLAESGPIAPTQTQVDFNWNWEQADDPSVGVRYAPFVRTNLLPNIPLQIGGGKAGDPCQGDNDCIPGTLCWHDFCVGTGRLRVSLSWQTDSDFDLHVITPTRTEIYFSNPVAEGGELDVDQCVSSCGIGTHVENIVFMDMAVGGTYEVFVRNYDGRDTGTFTIEIAGDHQQEFTGLLPATTGADSQRFRFNL